MHFCSAILVICGLVVGCGSTVVAGSGNSYYVDASTKTTSISYIGRVANNETGAYFDWVASGFQFRVVACSSDSDTDTDTDSNSFITVAGNVSMDITAGSNRFGVFLGPLRDNYVSDVWTSGGGLDRKVYGIVSANQALAAGGIVTVLKTTEDCFLKQQVVHLHGLVLPPGLCLAPLPSLPPTKQKRIDFYGDSDTAGFGVEGAASTSGVTCWLSMEKFENWADGWARRSLNILAANDTAPVDARVQAVSGIGVYRNAAAGIGTPTFSTQTMPKVLRRTLYSEDADDYNPNGWVPDLIVIYLGSNDYEAQLKAPTTQQFSDTYAAMTKTILSIYPSSPSIPVLHICGGEANPCDAIKAFAATANQTYTTTFDLGVPKAGCIGHRSKPQQFSLGTKMATVMAKSAGWH